MTGVTESVNKIKSSTDEEEKKALIESKQWDTIILVNFTTNCIM